ncbi:beta-Ala-His dipeptidase [Fusobacterium sp. PH5-44]|uniref:beta-Ala-His dipeptidase n=1 Tax=unclassified Fusobacterium TaxID=2648384 RepID=UPI003D22FD36
MSYILNEKIPHQKYFEDISKIPHGSKNEKEISNYLVDFAKKLNLKVKQDEIGNVIIYKNGSSGYESHSPVILQAHIDMVCEKNVDCDLDFTKDALKLYIEDGYVHAKGTTLGADDAYGVAYMMSILEDSTLEHPPLECVFTVQEEIGLIGAQSLKAEDFKGTRFINLDNNNNLYTYVSCSGGLRFHFSKKMKMEECKIPVYRLEIRGLFGGHSGGNIHLEMGNSNKIASRILHYINKDFRANLINIDGGSKENAIPRECTATFASRGNFDLIKKLVKEQEEKIKRELQFSDPNLIINIFEDKAEQMCCEEISNEIITMLYMLPNGPKHKNLDLDVVTASQNFGVIKTEDNIIKCTYSMRGALESYNDESEEILINFCTIFGFEWESGSRYPAWPYSEISPMRDTLKKVYKDFYGIELLEKATHGGLECGVFKKIIPDIDIVTIGPEAFDAHTPAERLNIKSFDDTYNLLVEYLKNL